MGCGQLIANVHNLLQPTSFELKTQCLYSLFVSNLIYLHQMFVSICNIFPANCHVLHPTKILDIFATVGKRDTIKQIRACSLLDALQKQNKKKILYKL